MIVRTVILTLLTVISMVSASSPAAAQACTAGTESDFDGDGASDLAIGDPDATVSGQARAGRVHIAYGDGTTLTIDAGDIPDNDNGAGERFGYAMDTVDWNGDGCTDLFIGVPFENWSNNTLFEAGLVVYIPGSPAGLDTSLARNWSQTTLGEDYHEAGDRFGWDLAAGLDTEGEPFLVIGVPGEDTTNAEGEVLEDIGRGIYVRPGGAARFDQNSAGFSDSVEPGDMFGYSVAASASGFVVGVPGEDAEYGTGTIHDVGTVFLIDHDDAASSPPQLSAWGQASTGISGVYEDGDMYGYSLDIVDYISTGGGAPRMMIAVGAPGEAIGSDTSSGLSMALWSSGAGVTQYKNISQDVDKNPGDSTEPGDMFGATVAMVNRTPNQNTSTDTLLMAAGAPGEDDSGLTNVGEIGLFSMVEAETSGGDPVRGLLEDAGLDLTDGNAIGSVLHTTRTHLWVTVRSETDPAVYGVPWDNIVAGGTDPVLTRTPVDFGLTAADTASFGASLA